MVLSPLLLDLQGSLARDNIVINLSPLTCQFFLPLLAHFGLIGWAAALALPFRFVLRAPAIIKIPDLGTVKLVFVQPPIDNVVYIAPPRCGRRS